MRFQIPTTVYQEDNCVANHASQLRGFGKKALIVTGKSSAKRNGAYQDMTAALSSAGIDYVLFDQIEENPSEESCCLAAELGCMEQVNFVIGIGGGSPMDAAKAIALLIGNRTNDGLMFYRPELATRPAVPVVCVPTTCGTGSEVTPYAILTRHEYHTKKSISHRIFPIVALVDPKYLVSAPVSIIRNTAIDALAHLIESYLNTNTDTYSRMTVEYGLKLWGQAKSDLVSGNITPATCSVLLQMSTIAGMAITHTGTSLPHGLSYYITYEKGLSHGPACGLFLAGYMRFCQGKIISGVPCKNCIISSADIDFILSSLELDSIDALENMINELSPAFDLDETLWKENVKIIMKDAGKLNNCPFEITENELFEFIEV